MTNLLQITKEHCQLITHCCILRSVIVQFVYVLYVKHEKTCIGATKWANNKEQTTKINLASLSVQVCTSNLDKKLQITFWPLVAAEGLEATKLVISPYSVAQLRQFF